MAQADPLTMKTVQARLNRAREALEADNLTEAHEILGSIKDIPGDDDQREDNIRRLLKDYSDTCIAQKVPPDWGLADQALSMLRSLELATDETETWWQDLKLGEADHFLHNIQIEAAFEVFTQLSTHLKDLKRLTTNAREEIIDQVDFDMLDIVRKRILWYAQSEDWEAARKTIECARNLWPTTDNRKRGAWLEIVSKFLDTAQQNQEKKGEELAAAQQKSIQWRNFTLILAVLYIVAFVVFALRLFYF